MKLPLLLVVAFAAPCALAQGVDLHWSPVSFVPGVLTHTLAGPPSLPFVSLMDFDGGPRDILGVRLHLGLTPALHASVGTLDAAGRDTGMLLVPAIPGLAGLAIYHQAVVLDPGAPNGLFRASNPQSSCLYRALAVASFDFETPSGYVGTYDHSIAGRLQGGPVLRRSVVTVDPQGVLFQQPLATFNPNGSRQQMVFRPRDLGSSGEPELVTGIEWKLHRTQTLVPDQFPRITVDLGHTDIMPDYTVDPFSALPAFPGSGLTTSFAGNYRPGSTGQRVYDGAYVMSPANLQPGGYLPYPAFQGAFEYNGEDSLLIDLRTFPSATSNGFNGSEVNLMVQSSPLPGARAAARGTLANPLDPTQVNVAQVVDNTMHDLRVHLARVRTEAVSPFRQASSLIAPDYQQPIAAVTVPAGTSLGIEYRGAIDAQGTRATPWSSSVDIADGFVFLQVRITFVGNVGTGAVPSIDTLAIPSN